MSPNKHTDMKNDGSTADPNAGRETPGNQSRAMTHDEALDNSSNDSMDASDPPAISNPNGNGPMPSSLSPEEVDKRGAVDEEKDVQKEMEEARKHADPSKGDKIVQGGVHVSTQGGGNPQE